LFAKIVFICGWVCGFLVSGGSLWSLGDSCKPNSSANISGAKQPENSAVGVLWLRPI